MRRPNSPYSALGLIDHVYKDPGQINTVLRWKFPHHILRFRTKHIHTGKLHYIGPTWRNRWPTHPKDIKYLIVNLYGAFRDNRYLSVDIYYPNVHLYG